MAGKYASVIGAGIVGLAMALAEGQYLLRYLRDQPFL